ncbi:MAG: hypothetical protein KBC11_02750 [Candidatus Pacebacteria bacterium]|nr:hypothetical protein [Candidatus Paceibacterota bacterium]
MKKISVLFLLATMFAINTKANETNEADVKNQYVLWNTVVPSMENFDINWLKSSAQGINNIPGAKVRANANSYIPVWGTDTYNKVLAADASRFKIVLSKGGEINWAVNASGQPVKSGVLPTGIPIIIIDNTPIAKWGTNGCLNALSVQRDVADDGPDPDNAPPGYIPNKPSYASNSNVNSNTVNNNEISWNAGYGIYSQGRNDRTTDFSQDAMMFMAIQKSAGSNCNTCPSGNNNVASVSYAQPAMYYTAPAAQTAPAPASYSNQNVTVRNKANGWEIANAVANIGSFGLNAYNTIAGQKVRVVDNRVRNNNNYNNGWSAPSLGSNAFQGSGALGASFSGASNVVSTVLSGGNTNTWRLGN